MKPLIVIPDTLSEGRPHPQPHGYSVVFSAPNPDYPSVPLGMRVSDLPAGWAQAGSTGPAAVIGRITNPKLTPEVVAEVRRGVESGQRPAALARSLGVARSTITRIVRRESWR